MTIEKKETVVKFIDLDEVSYIKSKDSDHFKSHGENTMVLMYDEEIPDIHDMELIPYNSLYIRIPQLVAIVTTVLGFIANIYLNDSVKYKKYFNNEITFLVLIYQVVPYNVFLILVYASLVYLLTMALRYSNYIL